VLASPPVGGKGEKQTHRVPLLYLVAGGTTGGLLLGSALGAFSLALSALRAAQIGLALGVAAAATVGTFPGTKPWWIPERTCQVSGRRLDLEGINRASFGWGLDLGVGLRTFVVTPAFYALIGLGIAAPNPLISVILGSGYGSIRALVIAAFTLVVRKRLGSGGDGPEPALGIACRLRRPLAFATIAIAVVAAYVLASEGGR
jgi:hypothetical protein